MPNTVETLEAFPDPAESLAILRKAMCKNPPASSRRVFATDDARSVEEGLVILKCYVAIGDRQVRQAILDALVSTTDLDPHA